MKTGVRPRDMVLSGLLLAISILLPLIFHTFGSLGPVLLPMHIPVLIGGLLLPPSLAFMLGVVAPLLSSAFTGMPVAFPIAIIMAFELGSYGVVSSLARRVFGVNLMISLVTSMVAGRLVAGLTVAALVQLFGVELDSLLYISGAIVTGLPGIALQIALVPPMVKAIEKLYD